MRLRTDPTIGQATAGRKVKIRRDAARIIEVRIIEAVVINRVRTIRDGAMVVTTDDSLERMVTLRAVTTSGVPIPGEVRPEASSVVNPNRSS